VVAVSRHLKHRDVIAIAKYVMSEKDGASLVMVCEKLGLTSPPAHMAAKRVLGWLRNQGMVTTKGGGKGMRYVGTGMLRRFCESDGKAKEAS
jgi:hypothetical protein